MPEPISWILIGTFLFLSFFFSAAETALACLNRFKIQIKADDGNHAAKLVSKVLAHYERSLTTVLIGHNVTSIFMSSISTVLVVNYLSYLNMPQLASIISSIILTVVVYLFGDTLPKIIAKAIPDTVSLISIYPIYFLMIVLYPITVIFDGLAKLANKIFKNEDDDNDFTEEDLESVVEQVSDEGLFEDEQSEIIQSAFDFDDTKVKEVFTPIKKIFAIDIDGLTRKSLHEKLLSSKYSRIPIYEKDYEHFIGVLHVKTYLKEYKKNSNVKIRDICISPYFVSQSIHIDTLFEGFKKHKTHFAFVVDKNDKVIGVVTMDDVLEELVSGIKEPNKVKGGTL